MATLTILVASAFIFGSLGATLFVCWLFDAWDALLGIWIALLILSWIGFGLLAGAAGWTLP